MRIIYLDKPWQHALGIMGKFNIKNKAYVFRFKRPKKDIIHMLFVFTPITILFVNEKKNIVAIRDAKPFVSFVPFPQKVPYVVEVTPTKKYKVGQLLDWV
ncbi:MAG: DUF192 domain-containing protein [Candidatus Woesearchaeota archaeon]